MLEEEGSGVESVERYAVRSVNESVSTWLRELRASSLQVLLAPYSLIKSNCSFFGSMSSIYGSNLGYSSRTFERMARWALDFTLDFAPEVMLSSCQLHLSNTTRKRPTLS